MGRCMGTFRIGREGWSRGEEGEEEEEEVEVEVERGSH